MEDAALTRRRLILRAGAAGLAASQLDVVEATAAPAPPRPSTLTAALNALLAGNRRYAKGNIQRVDYNRLGAHRPDAKPIAAIITCADSRISPSVIFDVGLGNVFVSRVAGNSIDTGTLGGTEYAVGVLGVPLVMVLGHSDCGAVKAAIDVANGKASFPRKKFGAIGEVVSAIVGPLRSVPRKRRTLSRCTAVNASSRHRDPAGNG
jgi:carbonic anhydrase